VYQKFILTLDYAFVSMSPLQKAEETNSRLANMASLEIAVI
jgi:hypothetical protein